MPTVYTNLPYPWLQAWLGPFDSSVHGFLNAEGRKLAAHFSNYFYQSAPEFKEVFNDNTMGQDQWPKYINQRTEFESGGKKTGEIFCEYCNWNPRDGESWKLMLSLFLPGEKNYCAISVQDNISEGRFELMYEDENPNALNWIKEMLDAYVPAD